MSNFIEIVQEAARSASPEELASLRYILLNRTSAPPPIPPEGIRRGTILYALYAARAIALTPLSSSLPAEHTDQVEALIKFIDDRNARFSLRSTKKVDPKRKIYSNSHAICAYLVNLFF